MRIAFAFTLALAPIAASAAMDATVYQSPACGCCSGWVKHLQAQGFKVSSRLMSDVTPVKDRLGVPESLRSCHTAEIAGYVIEGHVPAPTIQRLVKERPAARGIAAPGMPRSAPGMDGPYQPYDVILFKGTAQRIYQKF